MQTNKYLEDTLENEIRLGIDAQRAWDTFLAGYFAIKMKAIADAFFAEGATDDEILELKRVHTALATLEIDVKTHIETGKLASKQLDIMNK